MGHGVTIGANRAQVCNWVDFVTLATFRKGNQMMDVDVTSAYWPVPVFEVQTAGSTVGSVVVDAGTACSNAPFVYVYRNLVECTFAVLFRVNVVRTLEERTISISVKRPQDFHRDLVPDINRRCQSGIHEGGRVRVSPKEVNLATVLQ